MEENKTRVKRRRAYLERKRRAQRKKNILIYKRIRALIILISLIILICVTLKSVTTQTECLNVEETKQSEQGQESSDFKYLKEIPLSEHYQKFVWELCKEKNVSPFLIYGIIERESAFDEKAVSKDGQDIGLMQIRKMNHEWLNGVFDYELNYMNAYDNTSAGVYMFTELLKKNNGDIVKSLMCYNMGETGAKEAIENGVNKTNYTDKVLEYAEKWEEIYNGCC